MDYGPAWLNEAHHSFAWRPTRARLTAMGCAILVITPVVYDLFKPSINLTILYLLPLLFCAWLGQRRLLRRLMVMCIILTYLGLAARLRLHPNAAWQWSLWNRTFVIIALCGVAILLESVLGQLHPRLSWRPVNNRDAGQIVVEEVIFSAQRFAAVFAAVALSAGIFVVDLITPGQLNFPILYCMPILLIVWTRSHRWLWIMVSLLVVLAIIGWFLGEGPTVSPNLLGILMTNRLIAIGVLVLFAAVIHMATSPSEMQSSEPSA